MTTRRELVIVGATSLGILAAPLISFAQQQGKVWRVGYLTAGARPASLSDNFLYGAFRRAMRDLGYVEGKNLVIEARFADYKPDRLADLAAELVQLNVDVLVTAGTTVTRAAQGATTTIPIVMHGVPDPISTGFIKSLARPGGNITGVTNINIDLDPKRLELLLDLVPKLSRAAVLVVTHPMESLQSAGQKRRVEILRVEARTPQDIDNAFSLIRKQNAGALMVAQNPLFQRARLRIAELAMKYRLPSMTVDRVYPEAGCLMSYGSGITEDGRRAATFVDRILKGAKPGELPVEQPTKFELVINVRAAKALGLSVPQSLLISADKVIE